MKKNLVLLFAGFLIGVIAAGFTMYKMAPGLMILEDESKYNFEESVTKFEESVKNHGWKIPTVHDLQKTMKKYDYDVKSVKVFELCHPDHAAKVLKEDDERVVSSMMPCRVAIYDKSDGKTYVSRMNSGLMSKTMSSIIEEVMSDAASENEEIMEVLFE